ncbi:hypothetical protein PGB90_010078 [Kerria lacca]
MKTLVAFITLLLPLVVHFNDAIFLDKKSIFSQSKDSNVKGVNVLLPGYLPVIKIHTYGGAQINPVQNAPLYFTNTLLQPSKTNSPEQFSTQGLSYEYIRQLDILNRLLVLLPHGENKLNESNFNYVLSYVNLMSEDSLNKLQSHVGSIKNSHNSKLLKLIAFLKKIKAKKLKPFKYVINLGNNIINKKKEKLHNAFVNIGLKVSTTTPTPIPSVTEVPTLPGGYPFNYQMPNKLYVVFPNTFETNITQYSTPSTVVSASYNQVGSYVPMFSTVEAQGVPLNSENVLTFTNRIPQNNLNAELTPPTPVQCPENQYSPSCGFPQNFNRPLSQSQSFVQPGYQLQQDFDNFSPFFESQRVKQDTVSGDASFLPIQRYQNDQYPASSNREEVQQKPDLPFENTKKTDEYIQMISITPHIENTKKINEEEKTTENLESQTNKYVTDSTLNVTKLHPIYVYPENEPKSMHL